MTDAPGGVGREWCGGRRADFIGPKHALDGGAGTGGPRRLRRRQGVIVELAAGAFWIACPPPTATDGVGNLDVLLAGAELVVVGGGLGEVHAGDLTPWPQLPHLYNRGQLLRDSH